MNRLILTLSVLFFVLGLVNNNLLAQTKEERKAALKTLKKKATKDARKEAKRYRKKGYVSLPGQLPMEKQLEQSYIFAFSLDEKGKKKYYLASQEAKGETFAAAEQQTRQLCLNNIASEIGSNILGKIKSNVANAESAKDAASVTEVISGYQNTVAAKLGRTNPVVVFKKVDKKSGLTHVLMTMAYDVAAAERIIKKDLRKELKDQTDLIQDEIDELFEN